VVMLSQKLSGILRVVHLADRGRQSWQAVPMGSAQLVRQLYEAYQARDWQAAEAIVHPDAIVDMPATSERLAGRAQVVGFQRDYPEPWGDLAVLSVIESGSKAAAQVEVRAPDSVYRMAAFWEVWDGLLWHGTEYWVTAGEAPPPGRAHFVVSGP